MIMKKNILKIIFLIAFLLPFRAGAAFLYVADIEGGFLLGKETIVRLMLDTEGKEINAIEANIKVDNNLTVLGVDTGGSVFSMWPEKPTVSSSNIINFVGGVQGGVYGSDLRVINIKLVPQNLGVYNFNINNLSLYLAGGNGNKINGDTKTLSLKVKEGEAGGYDLLQDKDKPTNLIIELGKDDKLFDGKYFITFYAIDSGSGIKNYEIKEGRSKFTDYNSNTYVLKDQTLNTNITVRAIDNAGNKITQELKLSDSFWGGNIFWAGLTVLLLFILSILVFLIFRKKNEKK